MRHAISSIFKAATARRNATVRSHAEAGSHAASSPMISLNIEQLRSVVGGDDVEPDGLPKGGWKTTPSTAS